MRIRNAHMQLKYCDIELKKGATSGREYLEFTCELVTKTRDSTGKENDRKVRPRLYATDSDRYPFKQYKNILKKGKMIRRQPIFHFI